MPLGNSWGVSFLRSIWEVGMWVPWICWSFLWATFGDPLVLSHMPNSSKMLIHHGQLVFSSFLPVFVGKTRIFCSDPIDFDFFPSLQLKTSPFPTASAFLRTPWTLVAALLVISGFLSVTYASKPATAAATPEVRVEGGRPRLIS